MVPKLFSRVIIRFGEPIYVPENLDEEAFEKKRLYVEKQLAHLYEDTDRIWKDPKKIKEIFSRW